MVSVGSVCAEALMVPADAMMTAAIMVCFKFFVVILRYDFIDFVPQNYG